MAGFGCTILKIPQRQRTSSLLHLKLDVCLEVSRNKVVESAPVYSVPSRLQSEVSRLSPGGSVTGFPATHHWIRLDATEELNFISHWVFQHPSAPALRADWCKLNVLKKRSGILKVTWPGLKSLSSITPGFILYSLEWSFPPGRGGCGLVLAPETLASNFILCILVSIL